MKKTEKRTVFVLTSKHLSGLCLRRWPGRHMLTGGAWVPRCLRPRLASPTPFSTLWLCWGSSVQPAVNGLPQDLCESLTLLITLKSGNITEFPWDR